MSSRLDGCLIARPNRDPCRAKNQLADDMQLFTQFLDNQRFRRWMANKVFGLTYEGSGSRELRG